MNFNTILCNFESKEELHRAIDTLSMDGIVPFEYSDSDDELWVEFDISGCTPEDLSNFFGNPQLNF